MTTDPLAEARAALAEEEGKRDRLVRLADKLGVQHNLVDAASTLCTELSDVAGARQCAIYVAGGRDGASHRLRHATGDGETAPTATAPPSTKVEGSRVELPLVRPEGTIGVAHVARDEHRPFDGDEVGLLELMAKLGAISIARALALQEADRQAGIARAAVEANPDAIGLFGQAGEVVLENAPMQALREELEKGGWRAPFADRRTPGPRGELSLGGDRERTYARYTVPVADDDGPLGTFVALRDTTAEREAERARDRFLALVSHELRTPLTAIMGFVEIVLEDEADKLEADQLRAVQVIGRNTRRLHRLVTDLLFVAQVDAQAAQLHRAPVDLGLLVTEAVDSFRLQALEAGIDLRADLERSATVLGDEDRLGQLLDNLVSNALKFTPNGGSVVVRLGPGEDGRARLEVTDTGSGIAEDEQADVFEAFFRSPSAVAGHVPGVGLGLAVSRSIVRAHQGEIGVTSAPGAGTTFAVELPLATR
jgi:signal transduction histidine kinase